MPTGEAIQSGRLLQLHNFGAIEPRHPARGFEAAHRLGKWLLPVHANVLGLLDGHFGFLSYKLCPLQHGPASWPTSHRQNDAELRVTAQHARVSLARFFERKCFNHGTHAG